MRFERPAGKKEDAKAPAAAAAAEKGKNVTSTPPRSRVAGGARSVVGAKACRASGSGLHDVE
jgi:hypothetical protein